jgi:PAS domain S-box-containing protein
MERLQKIIKDLVEVIIEQKLWGVALILMGYSLLFPTLYSVFSSSSISFYLLPAVVIAYLYGPWWGLIGGLLFFPLHIFIIEIFEIPFFPKDNASHELTDFWITFITTLLIAMLVAFFNKTYNQLRQELLSRQKVSTALRHSEKRYRELLNHSNNIIIQFDRNGVIEYITPSAERLIQFPVREITGSHFAKFIHPDWRIRVSLFYARQIVAKTRKTYHEFPIQTKSGKTVWIAQILELLFDEGEPTGGQGVLVDITSRHEAQKALTDSEERFRALTEHSLDITMIVDENKTVTYINPSIQHITGFKPEDIQNQDLRQFVHPEDQTSFIRIFQQAAESKSGTGIKITPLRFLHNDGRWLYFDGLLTNMIDFNNVNGIVFNISEVTSRVEMEQALWESEYNFRTLFNQANDAVGILSLDGRVMEANERFATLLQLKPGELTGKFLNKYLANDEVEKFQKNFLQVATGKSIQVSETWFVSSTNNLIPVEMNMGVVKNSQGEPQKIISTLRDIGERKQT